MNEPVTSGDVAFVGSVPEIYDRYMGPLFFHDYADDLAARLPTKKGIRVLETACGTGIVTRRLLDRLGEDGALVATDLNDAMIARSKKQVPDDPRLERRQADATKLPFADGSFDAVVCQFGLMFFPDKPLGIREALRVLRPGGIFLFNVWDSLEANPVSLLVDEVVTAFFPQDPPQFLKVPFGLHDPAPTARILDEAGFEDVRWERVDKIGHAASAADVATALIEGTPMYGAIMERRPEAVGAIREAVAMKVGATLGPGPVRSPLRAIVFHARRGH
jgi:SAM-dependent methyltransferase